MTAIKPSYKEVSTVDLIIKAVYIQIDKQEKNHSFFNFAGGGENCTTN